MFLRKFFFTNLQPASLQRRALSLGVFFGINKRFAEDLFAQIQFQAQTGLFQSNPIIWRNALFLVKTMLLKRY